MTSRLHSFFGYGCSFFVGVVCTFFVLRGGDNVNRSSPDLSADLDAVPPPLMQTEIEPAPDDTALVDVSRPDHRQVVLTPVPANDVSTPIPAAWEQPLFSILYQTNAVLRNQGLIYMATSTALQVPRVQTECVRHLTYSLSEAEFAQFIFLANNPLLPIQTREDFLEKSLAIRRTAFSRWLATSLANSPEPSISALANKYLLEQGMSP